MSTVGCSGRAASKMARAPGGEVIDDAAQAVGFGDAVINQAPVLRCRPPLRMSTGQGSPAVDGVVLM
jgi:hypothetical protein